MHICLLCTHTSYNERRSNLAVPPGAINLSGADGSPLKILGYARFQLILEDITLPVEALVLPSLGPDILLLDNTIMGVFGRVLD